MSITIKLVDSNSVIAKDIEKALVQEVALMLQKNQRKFVRDIKGLIEKWINQQPEIDSLKSEGTQDSLNAQFGLPIGTAGGVVSAIIQTLIDSVQVTVKPLTKINGRPIITFSVQPTTFTNLVEKEFGKVTTLKGTKLEWLNWLLLLGNRIIVYGYDYKPDRSGRSGGGVMEGGSVFRVPSQFAGTAENNFITRALSNREKELQAVFEGLLR